MIEVLVGMLGTGKSTYARKRADESGARIICRDDIQRMTTGGSFCDVDTRLIHFIEDESVGHLCRRRLPCVIDRTNLDRRTRKRWVDIARAHCCPVVAVVFPPEDHAACARRRFEDDPRGTTLETWTEVARKQLIDSMVLPSVGEGFHEVRLIGDHPKVHPGEAVEIETLIRNAARVRRF